MRSALHAEWTKLRTVAGPLWLLLGMIAATIALSTGAAAAVPCSTGCDATELSLTGVHLGQALAAVLAVLLISGEYGTGMIHVSLAAVPRRVTVLAAKAVVLAGVVAVAGTVAVLGSLLAGRIVLPAPGPLADGPALRAAAGSVLHLVLIALLSLGIATAVRDSATGIGVVLGLLYVVPIVAQTIGDPHWQRLLEETAPMSAGPAVTAVWAAAALSLGVLLLHGRDV